MHQPSLPERPFAEPPDLMAVLRRTQLAAMENLRQVQGRTLDCFGFGTHECAYEVVASGPHWRLRHYAGPGGGAPLLLVPAPIKRPYIWDLTPDVSAVRFCLDHGYDVRLLEWLPPSEQDGDAGVEAYVDAVVAARRAAANGPATSPFVLGHSLGGTLAAIACALEPSLARGLVLLGAPLSFTPGSSRFRDLVVARSKDMARQGLVAGSQLSQGCAMMSPGTFVWSRMMDGMFAMADPAAMAIHMHIERWALDEVALPSRLVCEMVDWLYREDRFRRGALTIGGRRLGPADLSVPVLAVVVPADEIGPRSSVAPFFSKMPAGRTRIIEHPAEIGVGLQHLAILAGRRAHAQTWPEIARWIDDKA
ncbi:alpha/beta hydrolase [Ancylobacter mangrovi]|uniref:alpha/beta hydrolase n=1 Tax=Ancylobacter mangrovi TaxID=2972472 RepID=UPI00216134EA|nr:alpha/beta hydrolase [Ancylobacter mangrovi]MCS0503459.1 alpha/beta hydrolase [Ancylobacter mangrovi]